jgi:hypothetical protein
MSLRTENQTVLPPRPGWGTSGRAIKLRANFYPFSAIPDSDIHEFDVSIEPSLATKKRLRKRVFQLLEETPAYAAIKSFVVHDNSAILYSAKPIRNNKEPLVIQVAYRDEDAENTPPSAKPKTYTVSIKYIKTLNTADLRR